MRRDDWKRLALMLAASALFALNLRSFVQAGDLVPGGFSGLTLLLQRIARRFWGVEIPYSFLNFPLNAVPALVSLRLIGKRFTFFSCVVIAATSVLADLLPALPITDDVLLIAIFGGIVNGFSVSLCLLGRAASGGTDFIAIALSERRDVDAWNYVLGGNVVLLLISGALFGWDKALYSIIYQFASIQVVKLLDPGGRRATLLIVLPRDAASAVCRLIQDTHHSATLMEGRGLYEGQERVLVYTVVGGKQARALARAIRRLAPGAFVNVMRTDQVAGRFYRQPRD